MINYSSEYVKDFYKNNLEQVLFSFCKQNPDKDKVEKRWNYFCDLKVNFPTLPIIPIHLKDGFSYKDALIYSLYYYRTIGKLRRAEATTAQEHIRFTDSTSKVISKYFPFINKADLSKTNKKLFESGLLSNTKSPFYVFPPTKIKINKDKHYLSMPSILMLIPVYVLSYRERFLLATLYTFRQQQHKFYCKKLNKAECLRYIGVHQDDRKLYKKLEKMGLILNIVKDYHLLPRTNIKEELNVIPVPDKEIIEVTSCCPNGYEFGKADEFPECESCPYWDECFAEKEKQ